ncbi:MAG: hypothetical protein HFG22_07810 [Lachnospiraceae bacterium]|nr:hypothetical protein [Lachnospiraceae bacterium]
MSADPSKLQHYATSAGYCATPSPLQALGQVIGEDGQTLFSIAFTTHRDIITQIGYTASEGCPEALKACAACICELAKDQAIMAAELLGPGEISEKLSDDGTLDDQVFYFSVLATMGLKNALASYADYKKADLQAWKATGGASAQ